MCTPSFDLARIRRETPGCEKVIHFNNAGAALMPQQVIDAVISHLRRESEIGGYEAADEAEGRLEAAYDSIARLLNCRRDEVALVENATRAWDMAFYSFPFSPGDRILTSMAEYASNYISFLQVCQRTGAKVQVVPDDEYGQLDVKALSNLIDEKTALIAITHVPTNGGLVNPAEEIGAVARSAGVPFLLDACQSAGQIPLDVEHLCCDMLAATGRKYLRGPRGTGFLYVRKTLLESLTPAFLDLHSATWVANDRYEIRADARRFECWETSVAGRLGLGAAVDYALSLGVERCSPRIVSLAEALRTRLSSIPGVTVRDLGRRRCGIVSFTVSGSAPEDVCRRLRAHRMNVSYSPASSTLLDMSRRNLPGLVRASVHYYNTENEINRFCEAVARIAAGDA